ncbi:MAG: glycosyl hydrolase family 79 C-terminal domain-containing protein [Polyangiaceae bacterium]
MSPGTPVVPSSGGTAAIGPGFAGFSYEKTHIVNGSLTSTNTDLIGLYKLIGSPVIRLGADDVDNCTYSGTGAGPTAPSGQPFTKTIVSGMIDQLCAFLEATGGKVIYGTNYNKAAGNATVTAGDVAEVAYAMGKCGSSILGFEIGNEINRFGSWSTLETPWEAIATAVSATAGVNFVGPAAGGGNAVALTTPFAEDESAKFGSKVVILTSHYYAGTAGSTNPISWYTNRIQTPDVTGDGPTDVDGLVGTSYYTNLAAVKYNIPQAWRMGEVNTFAGHGEEGVSDTLIAALWMIDLAFVVAENGGSGINLHGGETGMDGSKPFYYEPIKESGGVVVDAQPEYYGQLMIQLAGTGPLVTTTVSNPPEYFTAYALKASGWISVMLDNKSATNAVSATVDLGSPVTSASAIYLQGTPAGSLTAGVGDVTVGNSTVSNSGAWSSTGTYTLTTSGNTVSVYVPAASAALVRVIQ